MEVFGMLPVNIFPLKSRTERYFMVFMRQDGIVPFKWLFERLMTSRLTASHILVGMVPVKLLFDSERNSKSRLLKIGAGMEPLK